eukprot:1120977-Pelagomonas_calceolata.AAC.4
MSVLLLRAHMRQGIAGDPSIVFPAIAVPCVQYIMRIKQTNARTSVVFPDVVDLHHLLQASKRVSTCVHINLCTEVEVHEECGVGEQKAAQMVSSEPLLLLGGRAGGGADGVLSANVADFSNGHAACQLGGAEWGGITQMTCPPAAG